MLMKKYLFIATALVALASCSDDTFVGDNSPTNVGESSEAINFSSGFKAMTRGDIYGSAAANLLGANFYVTGTKGTEPSNSPTTTVVFDNYLVHYGVNTAGTTASNTANWEYVGIDQASATASERIPENYDRVKLSSTTGAQTIKYWDYSQPQYDFLAFSTGTFKAVLKTNLTGSGEKQIASDEIGVTSMNTGSTLSSNAYTFYLPSVDALKDAYITDITTVEKANYGKEVTLKFKNLGSKVRLALYETVPGYSVKDVVFYQWDGTTDFTTGVGKVKNATAALISANTYGFPTKGQIQVFFPHVGTTYKTGGSATEDYNKAVAGVTPTTASSIKTQTFGALTAQLVAKERAEVLTSDETAAGGNVFLGRTLPTATFAGSAAANFYETVFPVSDSDPLTLRVDYTLVPIDGAAEVINVKGAKAVVPSTYTKWLPNYAYTYIFKISDNTNGWTGTGSEPAGLFPITFDAVVTEATEATGEQKTITTVATPSITTYQQGHDLTKNEYSKSSPADKDIYVQVMDNEAASPVLVGTTGSSKPLLNSTTPFTASLLYAVTSGKTYTSQPAGWPTGYYTDAVCNTEASGTFSSSTTYYKRCTEADVMDALENQSSVDASDNITGRNGVLLTKNTNINAGVTSIVNGVDDNPITVTAGTAAQIDISALNEGTYAYVYDYSSSITETASSKTETTIYQPITLAVDATIPNGTKYITLAILEGITYDSNKTAENEAVSSNYLYFSKTTNDSGTTTYSFVSVDGKTTLPAGLLKVEITNTNLLTSNGSATVVAGTICFDKYIHNNGSYAVKVIKVVD